MKTAENCFSLIKSDLFRYAGQVSTKVFVKYYVRHLGFRYSVWLRLTHSRNRIVCIVAKAMHRALSHKLQIQLPSAISIGPGLLIPHPIGIVVNSTAKIGANCTLSHFVTIGSSSRNAACIGNSVFIGPQSVILEDVVVGDNSTIGAGSVVTRDVAEDVTVAGNPAREVRTNRPGRLIKNPYMIA